MFVWIAKVTVAFQYVFYGENKQFVRKQLFLFKLKGNYTDNQTRSLMIAIQPTGLIFKLPSYYLHMNCAICVIWFLGNKFIENCHVIDIDSKINTLCGYTVAIYIAVYIIIHACKMYIATYSYYTCN